MEGKFFGSATILYCEFPMKLHPVAFKSESDVCTIRK
jgi:hypothetical protein